MKRMSKKTCAEKCQPTFERLYRARTRVTLAAVEMQGRGGTPFVFPLLGWGRSEAGLLQKNERVEVTVSTGLGMEARCWKTGLKLRSGAGLLW